MEGTAPDKFVQIWDRQKRNIKDENQGSRHIQPTEKLSVK